MAKKPNPVVVRPGGRPPAPSGGYTPPTPATLSSGSSSTKTPPKTPAKSGSSSSASKSSDPYARAQAAANARADAERNKAANRYNRQAKNLEAQARALQHALNKDLKEGLLQQLGDINQSMHQQGQVIREGFRERMKSLRGAARDNDKAQGQQSMINALNRNRERTSALAEAMSQGAGESDSVQAMMMALRNWNANQSEVERGYFDTLRSIKSSQTDLEVDTKTALMNNQIQANADKEQMFTNYFNQRSDLYTQLGNTRGQQADYYAMAHEMRTGGGGGGKATAKADAKAGGGKKDGGKPAPKPAGKPLGGGKSNSGSLGGGRVQPRLASFDPANPQPRIISDAAGIAMQRDAVREEKPRALVRPIASGKAQPPKLGGFKAEQGKGGRPPKKDDGHKGTSGGGGKGGQPKNVRNALTGPGNRKVGGTGKNAKAAMKGAANAFMQASEAAGRSWNNPGVTDAVMEWDGQDPIKKQENNLSRLDSVTGAQLDVKKPEGATLRKW